MLSLWSESLFSVYFCCSARILITVVRTVFAAFHGSCFHLFFKIKFHGGFVFELWTSGRLSFNFQKRRHFQILFISRLILLRPKHKLLMIPCCLKCMEGLCYEEQMVCG